MATRNCGKCNNKQVIENFRLIYDKRDGKSYHCAWCKGCERIQALERYRKNREKCIAQNKEYKAQNAEILAEKRKVYLSRTSEHVKARYKTYCENNKEKINEIARNYRRNNPHVKIKQTIANRLRELMVKRDRTATYLGCSMELVLEWIEFNFTDEITWETYGTYWHLDHALPVKCFNLENPDELDLCFNWKNLMPLEKIQNIKKSNRIVHPLIWMQEIKLSEFAELKQLDIKSYIKRYSNKLKSLDMRHGQIVRGSP